MSGRDPQSPPESSPAPAERGDLALRLAEADGEGLLELLRRHGAALDVAAARQALRHPFLTRDGLEVLLAQRRLLGVYEIRRALALHPKAPEPVALRFVPALAWRDLLAAGLDLRIRPLVRRAADRYLAARLDGLTTGEKVSVARRASAGVLERLRHDPSLPVVTALLDNPRLTEALLTPLVMAEGTAPRVLAAVARHRRWGSRHGIRLALCKNPRTPSTTALAQLPYLTKRDLREMLRDRRVPAVVRRRAELLSGG